MTTAPTLNETAALERHPGAGGVDLANAGRGIAATADQSIAVAWVQRYAVVYNVVDQIVDTPLFPVGFWPMPVGVKPWDFRTPWLKHPTEDPEDYVQRRRIAAAGGTTAALWGEGYGWSPPQSWRLIYVANGKASLYAEGVNALLRAQGFGLLRLERTDTLAQLAIRRPGGDWVEYEFTMADAERAGYVPGKGPNAGKEKKGGNEKYLTDPKTMLWARCLTIAARIEAPDVIAGMPVAELADDDPLEAARDVTVTATARTADASGDAGSSADRLRTALGTAAAARGHVDDARAAVADLREQVDGLAEAQGIEPEPAPEPDPVTDAQLRKLGAVFTDLGVKGTGERAERLRISGSIVGRPLTTSKELTRDEARTLIDTLEGLDEDARRELLTPPAAPTEPAADPEVPDASVHNDEQVAAADPWAGRDPWAEPGTEQS